MQLNICKSEAQEALEKAQAMTLGQLITKTVGGEKFADAEFKRKSNMSKFAISTMKNEEIHLLESGDIVKVKITKLGSIKK